MTTNESTSTLKIAWRVTTIVAVILLIFTVILVVEVRSSPPTNISGTIINQDTPVYLRNTPSEDSTTIAILDPGTIVEVDRSTTRDNYTWYYVKTENGRGWIPEINLDLSN